MPHDPRSPVLVLASASPRRRELLIRLNVPFSVDPTGADERAPRAGEDPAAYALDLAFCKAAVGAKRHPAAVVLGADTVVVVDGVILGKPQDRGNALGMLQRLRGRCHRVITAVAVRCGEVRLGDAVASEVWMRWVEDDELTRYIATGEPMDKAGSYALQGLGGRLVQSVTGCYNNVVGLPLCLSSRLLTQCGFQPALTDGTDVHLPPSSEVRSDG